MRLSVLSRTVLDGALVLMLLLTGWRVLDSRSRTTIVHHKNSVTVPSVKRGDIIRLPGVNWTAARTVVLVVSATCPYSNASTPFYKQLAALATPDLDIVAVAPEPADRAGAWLRTKGVHLVHGSALTLAISKERATYRSPNCLVSPKSSCIRQIQLSSTAFTLNPAPAAPQRWAC